MAFNSTLYSVAQFGGSGYQIVAGNFTFNGTGQPDAAEGTPFAIDGTDLVRSGAGVYTLTLPGRGACDVLACLPALEDDTDILKVQMSARDDSARTIEFTVANGSDAATDPTDGAKLHVLLILKS